MALERRALNSSFCLIGIMKEKSGLKNILRENLKEGYMQGTEMNKQNFSVIYGIKELPHHLNSATVSTGIIAGIFGWAVSLVLYADGNAAGWSSVETISWIFSCWVVGATVGFFLSLKYRMPIPGAWSIPGAALIVSGSLAGYTPQQLCVGFLLSGILVAILGFLGLINKVMRYLPMPVIMGMIAGSLFKFATNPVVYMYNWVSNPTVENMELFFLTAIAIFVFIIASKFKVKLRAFPPILMSLVVIYLIFPNL